MSSFTIASSACIDQEEKCKYVYLKRMLIMFFLFYSYSLCFYYFVPNFKFRHLCDIIMRIRLKQA